MIEMMEFAESNMENDRVVQMALRETDSSLLATAAVAMDQAEREIVYRNMSERARAVIIEEVVQAESAVAFEAAQEAKAFFVQKLRKYRGYVRRRGGEQPRAELPLLRTGTEEEILQSFVALVRFARIRGDLALDEVQIQSEFPLTRKGIELVVDGWEPMLTRSILDQAKRSYLESVARKLDMIIDGIDSLLTNELPIVTEERLRAYLVQ